MKTAHSTPSRIGSLIVIAHFFFALATSFASEQFSDQLDGLRIEAHHAFLVTQDEEKVLRVHATLFNDGVYEATVLTKTGAATAQDDRGVVVSFSFTGLMRQPENGNLIIPSLYPLEPVTLRPEEATILFSSVSGSSVQDLNDGDVIRVQYVVRDTWGERFNIWHGAITAEVVVTVPE